MRCLDEEGIVDFWFGRHLAGRELREWRKKWFAADRQFDEAIAKRFGGALQGDIEAYLQTPAVNGQIWLGRIILLDQFPRNIFRGSRRAFHYDPLALTECRSGLARNFDKELTVTERTFCYLPLEHAEDLECQRLSEKYFQQLVADADPTEIDTAKRSLHYARDHRLLIEKFGRFPHRNRMLERESTAAEVTYLNKSPSTYGQA